MGALIVIAIVSAVITKFITNYRVDHEYAKQGLDSPRYKVKLAKLAAAGRPASDAEVARPGAKGYFRELWNDAWEDATERRQQAREAKKAAGNSGQRTSVREQATNWWQWAVTPIGETRGDAQPVAERPVVPDVEPAPEPVGPRTACPECGVTLVRHGDIWGHPDGSTCAVVEASAREAADERTGSGCSVCGQPALAEPWCEHRQAALRRMRMSARAALARLDPDASATATVPPASDTAIRPWPPPISADEAKRIALGGERCTRPSCPGGRIVDRRPWPGQPNPHLHTDPSLQDIRCETCGWLSTYLPQGLCGHCKATPIDDEGNPQQRGETMTTAQLDLVDYNQAVAGHEQALAALQEQLAQAVEFSLHLTGATVAVEQMDANRGAIATSLAPLAEGMEGTRYDADSTQGSAEATSTLTAGSIAAVQEQIEAATEQNNRWTAELTASIEAIQASLQNIKSRYGEAAAIVQETGIDARALEEH